MTLLNSSGYESDVQFGWPGGQVTVSPAIEAIRFGVLRVVTSPATWGAEVVLEVVRLVPGGGTLAKGAPSVLVSTPEDAVESLEIIVLLMMFTAKASCSETPPPSQPATLLAMMLLVKLTEFQIQSAGVAHHIGPNGKLAISVPLTFWSRMPPPLPHSMIVPLASC